MSKILIPFLMLLLLVPIAFSEEIDKTTKLEILLIYSPSCPHCAELSEYLSQIDEKYGDQILIGALNISEYPEEAVLIQRNVGIPLEEMGSVPKAIWKGNYCIGDTPCIAAIDAGIKSLGIMPNGSSPKPGPTPDPNPDPKPGPIPGPEEKPEINILKLMWLALVDSINPCELAVLVILMTAILARDPKNKTHALKAGLAFSLAIFLMYFVFGVLIIMGFKFLMGFASLDTGLFYVILGWFAIILGMLNIKDAIWYGGGGFVMEVPRAWRPKMKKIIEGTTSIPGAFVAGLIVSFFLTPCTAGPYFVAGGILAHLTLFEAMPYLVGYLILFIFPMIAITLLTYSGLAAIEDIGGWRENNIKKLHWAAGLLLLGIGIAMVLGLV